MVGHAYQKTFILLLCMYYIYDLTIDSTPIIQKTFLLDFQFEEYSTIYYLQTKLLCLPFISLYFNAK